MEPINLILLALATGASINLNKTISSITSEPAKECHAELLKLLNRRFTGKPQASEILADYESDPAMFEKPMKLILLEANIDKDQEIVKSAQKLMQSTQTQQALLRNYNVQLGSNVLSMGQGDYQQINVNTGQQAKIS